jgi:hypothetical protein
LDRLFYFKEFQCHAKQRCPKSVLLKEEFARDGFGDFSVPPSICFVKKGLVHHDNGQCDVKISRFFSGE